MTTVRTTAATRGKPHRSRRRAAGAKAKLRSTDRASGLRTSPVKYMKAMIAKISIVSRNGSASKRVLSGVVTKVFPRAVRTVHPQNWVVSTGNRKKEHNDYGEANPVPPGASDERFF